MMNEQGRRDVNRNSCVGGRAVWRVGLALCGALVLVSVVMLAARSCRSGAGGEGPVGLRAGSALQAAGQAGESAPMPPVSAMEHTVPQGAGAGVSTGGLAGAAGGVAGTNAPASGAGVLAALPVSASEERGSIAFALWRNLPGARVSDLTGHKRFPDRPSLVGRLPGPVIRPASAETAVGMRFRGFLHPEKSGDYVFWVCADDSCELWLSGTESPDGRRLLASVPSYVPFEVWDRYGSQRSMPVSLEAGRAYYIEVLYKQDLGRGHLFVAWQQGAGGAIQGIPSRNLSPYPDAVSNYPPVADAGPDLKNCVRKVVTLDGSRSTDPDGKPGPLTYRWEWVSGPERMAEQATECRVSFPVQKAGRHVFRLTVDDGNATDSDEVTVEIAGDRAPEERWDIQSGLIGAYYEGSWQWLPDFSVLNPRKAARVSGLDLSLKRRNNRYAMLFFGYLKIADAGTYTFFLTSDDGSRMYIGDALVVDNDGRHSEKERTGSMALGSGLHSFAVTYFQRGGRDFLRLEYEGPNGGRTAVAPDMFWCDRKLAENPSVLVAAPVTAKPGERKPAAVPPVQQFSGAAAAGEGDTQRRDAGTDAGQASPAAGGAWAEPWPLGGVMPDMFRVQDLGLQDPVIRSGLGRRGTAFGSLLASNQTERAFVLDEGVVTDMGTLGGSWCRANAVNDFGEIVGVSADSAGVEQPFVFSGGQMVRLGTLGAAGGALAVNNQGVVAGWCLDKAGANRAVVWDGSLGAVDLNERLPASAGWVLERATAVSDDGCILGQGRLRGIPRTFILYPAAGPQDD